MYNIQFNGQHRQVTSSTLQELLEELQLHDKKIAIELNRNIILRADYPKVPIKPGDCIEVVQFVGGG